MKKKIFTLLTLLATAVVGMNAANFPDANYLDVPSKTQSGDITFTLSSKYTIQGFTGTSKFYGNSYTQGLKQEGATKTEFTTTGVSTITIVQTTLVNSDKTIYLNDQELSTWDDCIKTTYDGSSDADNQNVYVYKIFNVPAGDYAITRGSGQSYVLYVGITNGATEKVAISANTSNGGESTITGTGNYLPGTTCTLTAVPAAGKALDHWKLGGKSVSTENPYSFTVTTAATYTAVFIDAATKAITVESSDDTAGTATSSATTVSEGSSTTLTATVTAAEGYVFSNWTKSSDATWSSTTNPLAVSYDDITDGETYTANFKALYTVTYDLGEYAGTTTKVLNNYSTANSINEKYAGADDKYTIPSYAHRYLYRAGYRLTGWSDGTITYNTGEEITLTANTTLTPVWTATTQTLANSNAETTVTWTFDKAQILFNAWEGGTEVGYYTKPHTINGELIAVPMKCDATGGKIDNSSRSGNTQINVGTKFTIPAVSGMTITVNRTDNNSWSEADPKTFINDGGDDVAMTVGDKKATYTYTGTADEVTIKLNAGRYYTSIVVTYPQKTATITPAYEKTTFVTPKALDFTKVEGLKAYVATGANATNGVKISEVTAPVPAGTPLLLIGTANTEYTVPVVAEDEATAPSTNLLLAGDGTTVFDGQSQSYDYLLGSDGKFHRIASGKVATNKAYLHLESAPSTRSLVITFDDTTDGIDASMMGKGDMIMNKVFDLQGRRVVNPTKGLYIVGGKKMMVK